MASIRSRAVNQTTPTAPPQSTPGNNDFSVKRGLRFAGHRGRRNNQNPPADVRLVTGAVSINARGFGFLSLEDGSSYFIRNGLSRFLISGDQLTCHIGQVKGPAAEVVKLQTIVRKPIKLLATVILHNGNKELSSDEPCFIPLALAASDIEGLAEGDVVAVRLPEYTGPASLTPVPVTLIKNLGPRSVDGFMERYIRERFNFDAEFPDDVLAEAAAFPATLSDVDVDCPFPFVTIDGAGTLDIDDAVFARKTNAGYEVSVAIADVSSFVTPGSALDRWAAARCTSLYFPNDVTPMLPESLSQGICSLVEGEVRKAAVMTIQLDEEGAVVGKPELRRAHIRVAQRMTYDEMFIFMDGVRGQARTTAVADSLEALTAVYGLLSADRVNRGKLEFEDQDLKLVRVGDKVELHFEERNDAHKLIEELMLLINGQAAVLLMERYGWAILRSQKKPSADAWAELATWVRSSLGVKLPAQPDLRAIADLLRKDMSSEMQFALGVRIRSAMEPANYGFYKSGDDCGHFSLSTAGYTNFSSPIRRYVDLLVHRLLLSPQGYQPSADQVAEQAKVCAERAFSAKRAEMYYWDRAKQDATAAQKGSAEARVFRITARTVRVLVGNLQVASNLDDIMMSQLGYFWKEEDKRWKNAEGKVLKDGDSLTVEVSGLDMNRPAYPELILQVPKAA